MLGMELWMIWAALGVLAVFFAYVWHMAGPALAIGVTAFIGACLWGIVHLSAGATG